MFQKWVDDAQESAGHVLRLTSLAAAVAVSLFATTWFLAAAAVIAVFEKYGAVPACFAGAAVFFVVALIAFALYVARKRRIRGAAPIAKAASATKSAAQTMLADPMLLATGVQVARSIGLRRLIPILAIGGLALAYMASRNSTAGPDDATEDDSPDV